MADPATFEHASRHWLLLDLDGIPCPADIDPIFEPDSAVEHVLSTLPPELQHVSCWWTFTSSHGLPESKGIHLRLAFWSTRPLSTEELNCWLGELVYVEGQKPTKRWMLDPCVFRPVQPNYVAPPIFIGAPDPVPYRSGLWRGLSDAFTPPAIELRKTAPRPRTGPSTPHQGSGNGYEKWRASIGDHGGMGFYNPIKKAVACYISQHGSTVDPTWLRNDLEQVIRERGSTRSPQYVEDRIAGLDSLIEYIVERQTESEICKALSAAKSPESAINKAVAAGLGTQSEDADLEPYWPKITATASEASDRMQEEIFQHLVASMKFMEAKDYAEQLREEMLTEGMTRTRRNNALKKVRHLVAKKFPKINLNSPPRLQIAGSASLGKSSGVRAAFLRLRELWDRQIHLFTPTVALAREFEKDLHKAMRDMSEWPLVAVHTGRGHGAESGEAPCVRYLTAQRLANKVPSIYSAMCHRGEKMCWKYPDCGYIASFQNQGPGLHLFPHDYLTLSKPLKFPKADLVIVDEDATERLLTYANVPAAVLCEPETYQTAAQTDEEKDAATLGNRLLVALTSGRPLLAAVRESGLTFKHLQTLATWADPVSYGPDVTPDMDDSTVADLAEKLTVPVGETLGRILRQLARELKHPRDNAHGVEYRDGNLYLYKRKKLAAVPKGVPLLIIDADANLEVNRLVYGNNLIGSDIRAPRQGFVTQVYSTALSKSYLAPEVTFGGDAQEFQLSRGTNLRKRIQEWLTKKAENGEKKVLVVTNKPVRALFTGESAGKVPLSCDAHGVTWTHYGAILGVDQWKDYDVVVLIGREQISDNAAMEQARALACDRPEPLDLTAKFRKEIRGHRLRDGSAHGVEVWVHGEPLAQVRTEAPRERGMGQGIDRLRLIHGRPGREVFILSNIPLPDLEVDRLISLDALLGGGAPLERLITQAREQWGVLPLVPQFLCEKFPEIATSVRTAERLVSEFKTAKLVIESYYEFGGLKTVSFSRPKQRFPSTALVFDDLPAPLVSAALERLFGAVTVADDPPQAGQAHPSAPAKIALSPGPVEEAVRSIPANGSAFIDLAMRQPSAAASGQEIPPCSSVVPPISVMQPKTVDDQECLEQGEPGEYEPDLEEFLLNPPSVAPKLRFAWQNSCGSFSRSIENPGNCGKISSTSTRKIISRTGESEYEAKR